MYIHIHIHIHIYIYIYIYTYIYISEELTSLRFVNGTVFLVYIDWFSYRCRYQVSMTSPWVRVSIWETNKSCYIPIYCKQLPCMYVYIAYVWIQT